MLFVSPVFLFLFLPGVLALYYLLRRHRALQNVWLFLASIFFYAWGEPRFSLMLLLSIALNWLFAMGIERWRTRQTVRRCLLTLAVAFDIGLLFVYKYLDFSISTLNVLLGAHIRLRNIALPIGISFFSFQALSYVIDVYRGKEKQGVCAQKNPLNVGLYISFFPQLIAGPIVRYHSIEQQIAQRRETAADFGEGALRFMAGFSKKVLLANSMAVIADRAFGADALAVSFAWLGAVAYTLQIFFDFSGYSDMAIGLGLMFGFHFDENFRLPYASHSVTEFWRRWHISLSSWFRDYVYIPLGGNRCGRSRAVFNLFVVWLLTGIWHGANWTFIVWGLFYFCVLTLEKYTPLGELLKRHRLIGGSYTMLAVTLAWVVFRAESLSAAGSYLAVMFGRGPLWSPVTWVCIRENLVFFAVAFAEAAGLPAKVFHRGKVLETAGTVLLSLCFFASIIFVINGTYNPFIYFNF